MIGQQRDKHYMALSSCDLRSGHLHLHRHLPSCDTGEELDQEDLPVQGLQPGHVHCPAPIPGTSAFVLLPDCPVSPRPAPWKGPSLHKVPPLGASPPRPYSTFHCLLPWRNEQKSQLSVSRVRFLRGHAPPGKLLSNDTGIKELSRVRNEFFL